MKRFISFVLTLCMVMCTTPLSTATAAEIPDSSAAEEIDYMNYDLPEDAVILYQSEDGVVYQSKEQTAQASSGNQVSRWIEAGGSKTGVMNIKNPHTIVNTTNGVFSATSEYGQSTVKFLLTDGANPIVVKEVNAKSSPSYGIMIGCHLW